MLHDFIAANRDAIIARTRERVTNRLVHNAFKYTASGGHVYLRARADHQRRVIEVEDECGGIPAGKRDLFKSFGDRRGIDRSGLGLGLSIARQAIGAHAGDVRLRNMPGTGCVFVIELPLAEGVPLRQPIGLS